MLKQKLLTQSNHNITVVVVDIEGGKTKTKSSVHSSHSQSQKYTLNIWKEKTVNCTEIYNPDSQAVDFSTYFTFYSSCT